MAHLEAHLPESFEDERRKLEEEDDPNLACFAGKDAHYRVFRPAEEGGIPPQHRLLDLLQIISFSHQCDIHTQTRLSDPATV